MSRYTLTAASPNGTAFQITELSYVQTSVVDRPRAGSYISIQQSDDGSTGWKPFNITLDTSEPEIFWLAPNYYRFTLVNASAGDSAEVSLSPDPNDV